MIAGELQRIALRLSNSCWCRHWLNFNSPENPRKMAIQVLDCVPNENPEAEIEFTPKPVPELEKLGFKLDNDNAESLWIYVIDRTNKDGTPYNGRI